MFFSEFGMPDVRMLYDVAEEYISEAERFVLCQ